MEQPGGAGDLYLIVNNPSYSQCYCPTEGPDALRRDLRGNLRRADVRRTDLHPAVIPAPGHGTSRDDDERMPAPSPTGAGIRAPGRAHRQPVTRVRRRWSSSAVFSWRSMFSSSGV